MLKFSLSSTRHRMLAFTTSSTCKSLFSPCKQEPFSNNSNTTTPSLFRHVYISPNPTDFKSMAGRDKVHTRRTQPDKKLLKARDSVKEKPVSSSELSSLSQNFASEGRFSLGQNQAVGLVAAAQANFMRVIVESAGLAMEDPGQSTDLSPISANNNGSFNLSESSSIKFDKKKFFSESLSDSERNGEEFEVGFQQEGEETDVRVGTELLCVVRAVLKKIRRRVMVGDKVLVGSIDWVDGRGMIENVFKRSSEISDPPVANVDHLLVLFSMEQPKLEPFLLTRFLVEAESTGIPLTLALNKLELVEEETLSTWKERLRGWGYIPLICSVESNSGLVAIAKILKDQTSVIVGPSGVGKSSLINALRSSNHVDRKAKKTGIFDEIEGGKWFEDQRVGKVSMRSGRGKHTTRNVSLLPLSEGGYLADTPGFNQPGLMKVTKKSLAHTFPEVRQVLRGNEPAKCSFNDCLHLGEPGCVVKGDWERYPYYLQLLDEIKIREEFQLRTLGTKRESDVRYKMGDMGIKQAEPRLELKKHRRQSRKRLNQSISDELDDLDENGLVDIKDGGK